MDIVRLENVKEFMDVLTRVYGLRVRFYVSECEGFELQSFK